MVRIPSASEAEKFKQVLKDVRSGKKKQKIPSEAEREVFKEAFKEAATSGSSGGSSGGGVSTPSPTPTPTVTRETIVEKITSAGQFSASERASLLERAKIQKEAEDQGKGFSKTQIQSRLKSVGGSLGGLRSGTRKSRFIVRKSGALSATRSRVTKEPIQDVFSDNSYVGFQNIASADTSFKEPFTAKRTFKNVKTAFRGIGEGDRPFSSFDIITTPAISEEVFTFTKDGEQQFSGIGPFQGKLFEKFPKFFSAINVVSGKRDISIVKVSDVITSKETELIGAVGSGTLTQEQAQNQFVDVQTQLLSATGSSTFGGRKTRLEKSVNAIPLAATIIAPTGAVALGGFVAGAKSSQSDIIKVDIGAITSGKTSIGGASVSRPSFKTSSLFALGVGTSGIKALGGIKSIEKGLVVEELSLLSKQPVRSLQIIEQSAGKGSAGNLVKFKGFQDFGKLSREITFSGNVVKVGKDLSFLPRGAGKASTTGEFIASNILGKAGPTKIQAVQTFEVAGLGKSKLIGSLGNIKSFQTGSISYFSPRYSSSKLFQGSLGKQPLFSSSINFPSGTLTPRISKGGKKFIKDIDVGGQKVFSIDTGASLQLNDNVFLNFGNKRIGLTSIKSPVSADKVSIQVGGSSTKTPFTKTFGSSQQISTPSFSDVISKGLQKNQISIVGGGSSSIRGTAFSGSPTRQTTSLKTRETQISISPQNSKISSNIKSSQNSITSLGFSSRSKSRQRSGLSTSTNINQIINTKQTSVLKSGLRTGQQSRTRQLSKQRISSIGFGGGIGAPNFRFRTPFRPKGFPIPRLKKKTKTPRISRGLFSVQERRRKKFQTIGSGLSLSGAINLGKSTISKNISASFKIVGSGVGNLRTPVGFRRSKKEAGVFIERRSRRIKRRGTSQENIQLISAKSRKRSINRIRKRKK